MHKSCKEYCKAKNHLKNASQSFDKSDLCLEKVKNKFTPASSNSSHSNNKDAITLKKISEREIVFQDLEILNTSEI